MWHFQGAPASLICSRLRMEEITQQLNLEASLQDKATCKRDPQAEALNALKSRQLKLFALAVKDKEFNIGHKYETGLNLLHVAINQWESNEDTHVYCSPLMPCWTRWTRSRRWPRCTS